MIPRSWAVVDLPPLSVACAGFHFMLFGLLVCLVFSDRISDISFEKISEELFEAQVNVIFS